MDIINYSKIKKVEADLAQHKLDYASQRQQDQLKVAKVEKDINDYQSTMASVNVNQEAKQKVTGYGTISLPKNTANGQVNATVAGQTATNLVINGKGDSTEGWLRQDQVTITEDGFYELDTSGIVRARLRAKTFAGRKYLLTFVGQCISGTMWALLCYLSKEASASTDVPTSNGAAILYPNHTDLKRRYAIFNSTDNGEAISIYRTDAGEGDSAKYHIKEIMLFDVTDMEGTDEEIFNEINTKFPHYFSGTKSTVSAIRLKSVNEDETKESILYVLGKDKEGNILELRSLPNGTKDEISLSKGKLIKRVSDEYTINSDLIQQVLTRCYQEKATSFRIFLNIDNTVPSITTIDNDNAYIVQKGIKFSPQSGWGPGSTHWDKNFPQYCIFPELNDGRMSLTVSLPHTMTGWEGSPILQQIRDYFNANPATLNYQLATPIEIPIQTSGSLVSYPSGTVYIEPYVADAGIYTNKMEVLHQDLPIKVLEKLSKIDFMTGLETELDVSDAIIAEDKLSFTHPDLEAGDIVFFVYEYDRESTVGETEIEYYDSRYVVKDDVTEKFYKWAVAVADGVPSIELTEV